ncbi:phage tail tape measure protein [Aurantivibrio plasticivorans]
MTDTALTMRLALDASRWSQDWQRASRITKATANRMSRNFGEVGQVLRGIRNNLAAIGVTIGAVQQIAQSAHLDKSLILTKQTAGATATQIDALRDSLFDMSGETGQSVENLKSGFDQLIQAGLSFEAAFAAIPDINRTMAVSSTEAQTLANALTVAANIFEFDLSNPGQAANLLDKMVVAGIQGNLELENLSDAFAKVGSEARLSGLSIEKTLALLEAMSQKEANPERLATSFQSALRIFTDQDYKAKVAAAMGSSISDLFYTSDNKRRDVFSVLDDISKRMSSITNEKSLDNFVQHAFGETNIRTREGLIKILTGDTAQTANRFATELDNASQTVKNNLDEALDNSISQAARLRGLFRQTADDFSKPINRALADLIQYATNAKTKGGLGLEGKDLVLGAGGLAGLLAAGKFLGPKILRKISGNTLGTIGGVAVGKSLEATAGVTPVYVVNMPGAASAIGTSTIDGIFSGALNGGKGKILTSLGWNQLKNQAVGSIPLMGSGAVLRALGFVGAAGATGYGVGTALNKTFVEGTTFQDKLGGTILQIMSNFGVKSATETLDRRSSSELLRRELEAFSKYKLENPKSELTIRVVEDKAGRSRIEYVKAGRGQTMDVVTSARLGPSMGH